MKPKIIVACDVDGCILNFTKTFSEFIQDHCVLKIKNESVCWSRQYGLFERFDLEDIESWGGLELMKKEFESQGYWKRLHPMKEMKDWKTVLDDPDFEVHFVTSIDPHLILQRCENLSQVLEHPIEPSQIHCVPLGLSKKPYIDALKPHVFIEDNLTNLHDCDHSGHVSLWIDLKETCYKDHPIASHVIRISNLNEAVLKLKEWKIQDPKNWAEPRGSWIKPKQGTSWIRR